MDKSRFFRERQEARIRPTGSAVHTRQAIDVLTSAW